MRCRRSRARMLDEYLAERGDMLVTGYDLTSLTLARAARPRAGGAALGGPPQPPTTRRWRRAVRADVPAADQPRFDMLLADARGVMDMRDDNGPVTVRAAGRAAAAGAARGRSATRRRAVACRTPSTPSISNRPRLAIRSARRSRVADEIAGRADRRGWRWRRVAARGARPGRAGSRRSTCCPTCSPRW